MSTLYLPAGAFVLLPELAARHGYRILGPPPA
jgi:hypothetical protein